jgi:ABC-type uncharacterized transport system ATPase subunit
MSFTAKLKLDEDDLNVLQCSYRFTQMVDATGRPTSIPHGGTIRMLVESNGKTALFDWMISITQLKSGKLTFFRRDSMSKLKVLEFIDAHCIDYFETFNHLGEDPMCIQLTISAREIKLEDSLYTNNWPK